MKTVMRRPAFRVWLGQPGCRRRDRGVWHRAGGQCSTWDSAASIRCAACIYSPRTGGNIVGGAAMPKAIVEGINFNGDGTAGQSIRHGQHKWHHYPFQRIGGILHGRSRLYGHAHIYRRASSFDIFVESRDDKQVWIIQTGPTAAPAVFQGTHTKVSN